MRTQLCFLLFLLGWSSATLAAPLSSADEAALRALSDSYVRAWINNDRTGVMGVMAPEAVFIPHDGVQPHIGRARIDEFWFPQGSPIGTVPAYTQAITSISGDGGHATMYGRFDLSWQNSTKRYNWTGNWLIVARKDQGRWLITHMMANDADPTISDL
jgi:uncharacterized protein (TIGR02246 family)